MIARVHGNDTLARAHPHTHTSTIIKLAYHLSIWIVLSFFSLVFMFHLGYLNVCYRHGPVIL